ncbi:hypothetical protein HYU40_01540 [Candidatus Woesearchaeota archaeon]|nr:hypothetical protein [Candidatus Woesearchaeota archaeon]
MPDEAQKLFSEVIELIDNVGGIIRLEYESFLVRGLLVYEPVVRKPARFHPWADDDILSLQVPWPIRKSIIKASKVEAASIDDFVKPYLTARRYGLGQRSVVVEYATLPFVNISYVFPSPARLANVSLFKDAHVIVSVTPPKSVFINQSRDSEKTSTEVAIPPGVLAGEMSIVSEKILAGSQEGSDASGKLRHTLDAYVRTYVVPLLRRLEPAKE